MVAIARFAPDTIHNRSRLEPFLTLRKEDTPTRQNTHCKKNSHSKAQVTQLNATRKPQQNPHTNHATQRNSRITSAPLTQLNIANSSHAAHCCSGFISFIREGFGEQALLRFWYWGFRGKPILAMPVPQTPPSVHIECTHVLAYIFGRPEF